MHWTQLKQNFVQPAGLQTGRTQVQQCHETFANKCKGSRQKQLKVTQSEAIVSPSFPKR